MDYRPALRKDIELKKKDDGVLAIGDPLLGRAIDAGPVTRALVERLDGTRTLESLLDEVARERSAERSTVEHTFRNLVLMNVVEGAGTKVLEKARSLQETDRKTRPVFLEETRFQCQGSGQCCQIYDLGPLDEEDVKRLNGLGIEKVYPELGPGPYVDERETKGQKELFLKSSADGGRCMFLLPDGRCGIHAAFGSEAKPAMCRLFPWTHMTTIEGLVIFDRAQCSTFATSARAGPTLESELPAVFKILPRRIALYHPIVILDAKTRCDYGHVLELRRALLEIAGRVEGTAGTTLRSLGATGRAFTSALATCPLSPGEPDATIASVLARREPPASSAPTRDELLAIATVAGAFGAIPPNSPLTRQGTEVFRMIEALARHRADPGRTTCPEWILRVAAMPIDDPEIDQVLRLSFRKYFFGDNLLIEDDKLVPALLRLGLVYLVTLMGAKLRATAERADRVRPNDLSFPHMIGLVALRKESYQKILVEHEKHAWDTLSAAPSLVELAAPV